MNVPNSRLAMLIRQALLELWLLYSHSVCLSAECERKGLHAHIKKLNRRMTLLQQDPSAYAPCTRTTVEFCGRLFHLATALSPLGRLNPCALRNFFIAEEISATCVSIAKCPVSKN